MNNDGCTPLFISSWLVVGYVVRRNDYLLSEVMKKYPFDDIDISLAYDDWKRLIMIPNRYYNVYKYWG